MADGMSGGLYVLGAAAGIIVLLTCWEFLYYLVTGEMHSAWYRRVLQILAMIAPVLRLMWDIGVPNDCCNGSALFSPDHRLSVVVLIFLCLGALFYSAWRTKLAPPLLELIVNCLLLTGVLLAMMVGIQAGTGGDGWISWVFGIVPVIIHFILVMADNHRLAVESLETEEIGGGRLVRICRRIVLLSPWAKFPILLVLCLPVLCVLIGVLLVFGQKPDSLVRAFTDTYYNGLSQLDNQCNGVVCGGHYLCTIAAKGHPRLVRPIRMGERGGKPIKCNRQLLVSNAFEELLEQRLPGLHRPVRRLYNKIGAGIHRYYGVFDHAWVSDLIYISMKPLEWGFVAVLYLSDRRPEDRIARQYLRKEDAAKCVEEWGMRWVGMRGTII